MMMNGHYFTTINMEIYIYALPAPLSCFKNVQIHTAQNSANKTLNNKTKSLMTLTPFYCSTAEAEIYNAHSFFLINNKKRISWFFMKLGREVEERLETHHILFKGDPLCFSCTSIFVF